METIKYEKHSNRLFAKPLFNIRDDSKEKGRVCRNNSNPKTVFFQKRQNPTLNPRFTDTRRFLSCYALVLHTRSETNKEQRTFYSDSPLILTLFMHPPLPSPVSVSTWFDLNSTEVPSSTVCDMNRYFHNLSLPKSSFQSKGGAYRLLGVLQPVFLGGVN